MIAGGCRCGAVRYTLAVDALPPVYCCHCLDCQTWSGSAFAEQAVIAVDAIAVEGQPVEYAFTNPSGSTSRQFICGICHSRVYNTNSARPGLAVVRAGTLDESDRLVPRAHIWVKRKQAWIAIPDDVPQFAESAPVDQFARILLG
ncbi:GFA family protein [Sphingomonas sp. JC676]|uniref:GFA family protein n=1 Tax=Sphingomonas sp. JC676 TaxID=2768065 RepID=UPI0016585201|nr:GFA family protein [Sphingomonas sp. JC676]MBC9032063.1 GFA family protein [Sphingomonas sp. JC676]